MTNETKILYREYLVTRGTTINNDTKLIDALARELKDAEGRIADVIRVFEQARNL